VLAVGLVLGLLVGCAAYLRILQEPLAETIDASYGRLPTAPRPWLAALPRPRGLTSIALGVSTLLALTTAGLVIVLVARPDNAGADLSQGLAVGLVAAYVSLMCGTAWAFGASQVKLTLHKLENRLVIAQDSLRGRRDPAVEIWRPLPGIGEVHREVFGPDWPEHRYPDLRGLARADQWEILRDKMVCDAMIGVQIGVMWAMPVYILALAIVPAMEALAAGSLWRRHRRLWPVLLAYAERIIPIAVTLLCAGIGGLSAVLLVSLVDDHWLSTFQRTYWPMESAIAVLVVAQVAVWRGWSWWLRVLLHFGWIGLVAWAMSRLP
jgi:hypothetical protein